MLGIKLRDEHAGLHNVPGLTGGGHVALALGEDEQLIVLLHRVDVRGHGAAGLQGAVGKVGLVELPFQHRHLGKAVDKVVLHITVTSYLDLRHGSFPP